MPSKIVSVEEAEARLLELIDLAEQGEEIVISHGDQLKVKLVPIARAPQETHIWPKPGSNPYQPRFR